MNSSENASLRSDVSTDASPVAEPSAAFTPGPWTACKGGGCTCGFIWDATGDVHLASAHDASALGQSWFGGDVAVRAPMRAANARLIAAAPDQHTALVDIADGDRWHGQMRFAEDTDADFLLRVIAAMRATARAAIAKALGREAASPAERQTEPSE